MEKKSICKKKKKKKKKNLSYSFEKEGEEKKKENIPVRDIFCLNANTEKAFNFGFWVSVERCCIPLLYF